MLEPAVSTSSPGKDLRYRKVCEPLPKAIASGTRGMIGLSFRLVDGEQITIRFRHVN